MQTRTLIFGNNSANAVHLIVEPIADTYQIEAGEDLTLSFVEDQDAPAVEVYYNGPSDVTIFTHTMTEARRGNDVVQPT